MAEHVEVLMVGGGPTGLFTALCLARMGIACRVVERTAEHFVGSRGKGVMPRTLEAFDDLGVIDEILERGEPNPTMRLFNGGQSIGILYFQGGDGRGHATTDPDIPYPVVFVVAQSRTEEVLRTRLRQQGVEVEMEREFVGLTQGPDGVTATIRDTRSNEVGRISCEYLVGADGGRSAVRAAVGVELVGTSSEEMTYVIGDMEIDGLDHACRYAWMNDETGGFVQATPMHDSSLWQFGGDVRPGPDGVFPEPSVEVFQQMFDETTTLKNHRLHDPVWMSKFIYQCRRASRFRVGRVLIAGDAAHVHSPVTGEGLNSGVQDAYNLAWKLGLVIRGVDDSLLDTYEEERPPVADALLSSSSKGHMALFSTKPFARLVRQGIVLPALRIAPINRAVMRRLSGLGINYRRSSLSVERAARRGKVHAGDRAPDGRGISLPTGNAIRLFDSFRGAHFTVLGFGKVPAEVFRACGRLLGPDVRTCHVVTDRSAASIADDVILDRGRTITRRIYGVRGAAILVIRPDGYVGYRGSPDVTMITDYLQRFKAAHRPSGEHEERQS